MSKYRIRKYKKVMMYVLIMSMSIMTAYQYHSLSIFCERNLCR